MRQLTFIEPGLLRWEHAPEPALEGAGEALVRPLAVARCDLDAGILRGEAPFKGALLHWLRNRLPERVGQRGIFRDAPFRGPYAFGHECIAEVLAVGDGVRSVRPGDRVVVPFQVSCGACAYCARGLTANCRGVPAASMYGFGALGGHQWGGVLADVARVPFADAMLVPAPAGVSNAALASAGDNVADGYRTVAGPLAARPGAPVLVVGGVAASVGLYAVACAVALGSTQVDYLDASPAALRVAERLGARALEGPYRKQPKRYPVTVDASAHPDGLAAAVRSTEPAGVCTSVGIYYSNRTPMPLLDAYGAGLTFVTGRVCSRAVLPELLALISSGKVRPELVTTRVAAWDDAPHAFLEAGPKVIVERPALGPP